MSRPDSIRKIERTWATQPLLFLTQCNFTSEDRGKTHKSWIVYYLGISFNRSEHIFHLFTKKLSNLWHSTLNWPEIAPTRSDPILKTKIIRPQRKKTCPDPTHKFFGSTHSYIKLVFLLLIYINYTYCRHTQSRYVFIWDLMVFIFHKRKVWDKRMSNTQIAT